MKLRNKKTGEIAEPFGITCVNGRTFVQFDDEKGTFKFEAHSLAELNEEWEDAPEEPKQYWTIDCGTAIEYTWNGGEYDRAAESVGLKFDTKEECERAIEKMKAWTRLEDKGFRFKGISREFDTIYFDVDIKNLDDPVIKDLNLLFGGEE